MATGDGTPRTYTISTETANGAVYSDTLETEITAASLSSTLDYIATDSSADSCSVYFLTTLSAGDQTTLDGVLLAHTGVAPSSTPLNIDTVKFGVLGRVRAETGADGAWIASRDGYIAGVTLYRRTAGDSGSTTIDVHKNGTTVFTNQNIRPSVATTDGNNAHKEEAPDVTTFSKGDRFEVDVDAVETGNPLDIAITMEVQYT
jgi:hypothetical protein